MAEKDIQERRLKPVYELIDSGNYKGAVQQTDRIVKKHGQIPAALALKALALNRMNKREMCLEILEKMKENLPTDLYTLQSMAYCYRDTRKFSEIPLMYASALKQQPKNEELMTRLFMAYASNDEYQKQKQTALELHKQFPSSNPYYFWAVMSVVMQIHASQDEQTKSVLITLAERMAQRYKDKFNSVNELKLYLNILKLNKQYEDILPYTRLDTESELRVGDEDERFYLEVECLTELGRWGEALHLYKLRCDTSQDDWLAFKGVISCSFKLHTAVPLMPDEQGAAGTSVGTALPCIESTMDYIDEKCQLQLGKKGNYLRGPFLARMELILQLREKEIATGRNSDLLVFLKEYFELFGAKKCWFDDMTLFADRLVDSEKAELISCIGKLVAESAAVVREAGADEQKQIKHLQRDINLVYIARYLGLHDKLSVEEKEHLVSELMNKHYDGLALGTKLTETEFQHGDPYANVATHILIDLYNTTADRGYLLEALAAASAVLKNSDKNYLIRLLKLKIHAVLGGIEDCTDQYQELEIKHLQAESLCYLLDRSTLTLGLPSAFRVLASNCLALHRSNRRDTSEYIETAYKNGSFEKVLEMVRLKNRFSDSYHKKSIDLSSLLFSWIDGFSNAKLTELKSNLPSFESWYDMVRDIDSDTYRDNRDFNVIEDYTPSYRRFNDRDITDTFSAECIWIRARCALITCIGSAVELSLLHCELEGNVVADTVVGGAGNEGSTRWHEFVSLFEKGIEKFDEEMAAAIAHPLYSAAALSNTSLSGTCLIRQLFKLEKFVGLERLTRRVYAHLCREIMSDRDNSGLYKCRIRQAKLRSPPPPMLELLIPPKQNGHILRSSFKLTQAVIRSISESGKLEIDPKSIEALAVPLTEILNEITSEEFVLGKWERIFLSVEKITTLVFTISIVNICILCIHTLLSPKAKKPKKKKKTTKLPDLSEAVIIVDSFLKSTLIPVCKELQSYVSNSLNYFNEIDLDFVLTDVLKIQPNAEPPLTSVTYEVRKRSLLELTSSYTTSLEKIGFTIDNRIKLLEQI